MPRQPRAFIEGYPFHCIARGNNRHATFYCDDDYAFYLSCFQEYAEKYHVAVHAYVLMTNHVHFLLTPSQPDGISRTFQAVGRLYVRYINKTYRRSGTLWEGRFKASLVDANHYLLACYRYIELNPVRAGMVNRAEAYPWSSARHNLGIKRSGLVTAHARFVGLGTEASGREAAYRKILESGIPHHELSAIRKAGADGRILGNDRFQSEIEKMLGRSVRPKKRGPKTGSPN